MKIISYKKNNSISTGVLLSNNRFINIDKEINFKGTVYFLENFNDFKAEIENLISLSELKAEKLESVELLSPIDNPSSLRDAYAFRQHVETSRKNRGLSMINEFDEFPVYYYSNHNAITGAGDVCISHKVARKLDYELEVAVIIGKKGINISASEADTYIAGFTVMNDFSSRKIQLDEMKLNLGPAKGKDFATALGPHITTADQLSDLTISTERGNKYDVELKASLNGELLSSDNLKNMNWTFAQIIERISCGTYIYPGDIIGSGTCATGCLYELNSYPDAKERWLKDGDIVEIEAGILGSLKNTVKIT